MCCRWWNFKEFGGCGSSMYLPSIAGGPLALSFGGNWIAIDSGSDVQESHLTFPSALRFSHSCLSRAWVRLVIE
jgi:hypothetical protein